MTYEAHDRERWAPEPSKRPGRTAFERDRARVLHSAALRRLAAKTQVFEAGAGGPHGPHSPHSPRTRLTHSLECAQVGRELGKTFGCDPDLVEAACLAHDIGHPPFGHNGEATLAALAAGCGGFEGNAQSLRILTRLEPKSFAPDGPPLHGRSVGLNLTRATLDAAMKYPWRDGASDGASGGGRADRHADVRGDGDGRGDRAGAAGKFGIYDDDADVAAWVRERAPIARTCFEAQVMDWSDDVAYSVHDLEDALIAGHVRLAQLADRAELRAVCLVAARWYCAAEPAELEERFQMLRAEPYWPRHYDGSQRGLAALKNLTSELIGRLCRAAEQATREAYGGGPLTRYAADLIVPRAERLECAVLKGIAAHYVMGRASHTQTQARQREVITELVHALADRAPDSLEPVFRAAFKAAPTDAARLRVVVDQVASLTDTSATAWHHAISRG
ncbi:MAG TPA: deoxyguanosinetriphosphate triphosphohydrolase [Streptosporangiaceae bacterium]|nr:deoxyguanosinetriphosphate triphosphohydrolase [Streptosporangiaceae bacterium]